MIRMPKGHIADNVVQRIMAIEQREASKLEKQSLALDQAIMQPPSADMASVPGIEEMIPARALDL